MMSERRLIGFKIRKGNLWIADRRKNTWIFEFVERSKAVVFVSRVSLYCCMLDLARDKTNYPMEDMSDVRIVHVYKRAKR